MDDEKDIPQNVKEVTLNESQLRELTADSRYDNMSEEEYMAEMEKKVEYYKIHYPDMYEKAMQWLKMLDHSEVYRTNSGDTTNKKESSMEIKAHDILKNVLFHGLDESDLTSDEISTLNQYIPDWRTKSSLIEQDEKE